MRNAQEAGQLSFKMEQSSLGGGVAVQEPKRPFQEIEDVGHWEVGFGAAFNKLDRVCRQRKFGIVGAEAGEGVLQEGLAQGVQISRPRGLELDFAQVEQIQHAREPAFGSEGPFGNRFDPPVFGGEPGEDQAAFRETDSTH